MSQQSLTDVLDSFDKVIENHVEGKLLEVGEADAIRDAERTRFRKAGGKDELAPSSQAGPDERAAAEKVLGAKAALRVSVAEFGTAADQKIAVIGAHGKALAAAAADLEKPKYRDLTDLSYDPDWEERLATYPEAVQGYMGEVTSQMTRTMKQAREKPLSTSQAKSDSGMLGMLFSGMRDRVFRAGSYWSYMSMALRRFWGAKITHEWAVLKLTTLESQLVPIKVGSKTYMVFANDAVSKTGSFNDKEDAGAMYSVTGDMLILHVDRKAFPQDVPLLERWKAWLEQYLEYWGNHGIGGPKELSDQMKREGWYVGIPFDRVVHPFLARLLTCHNLYLIFGDAKYLKNVQYMLPMVLENFHIKTMKRGTKHPTAAFTFERETPVAWWSYDVRPWTYLENAEPKSKIKKSEAYDPKRVAGQAHMSVYAFLVAQQMLELWFRGLLKDTSLLKAISNTMTYSFFMGAPHELEFKRDIGGYGTKTAYCWNDVLGCVAQRWSEREMETHRTDKRYWVYADDGVPFHPCHYEEGGFGRERNSVEGFPVAASIVTADGPRLETYLESIDTSNIPNEVYLAIKGALAFEGRAVV